VRGNSWQSVIPGADAVARLVRDDVVSTLIKDGDQWLSRPEDIERLLSAVAEFSLRAYCRPLEASE
jgi:hypothetical protein